MIWLLISQGFARHVNENSEKLRPYFVKFSEKTPLGVITKHPMLTAPDTIWEKLFPKFINPIREYTGKGLMNVLSADFSTTTITEQVAFQITIMEAVKSYFEYQVFGIMCGIPQITLLGTTEDWQKIQSKVRKLAKYDLSWWTDELEPLLNEFVNASQGKVNKEFWRDMFKLHRLMGCAPESPINKVFW